ncbi:hypothetical protein PG993_013006 [Apiospora rasikravindrae]|uniref:Uncharacterized protein n=1 Tax=Apiospora rasikravindrae TaxID=990691 RepID=A0ABR1RWF7_9PEZI
MSGITKPLTKPQAKRVAQSLRPAAVKNMKIDLSIYDARSEEYCTYPKRALSRLSNQVNRTNRQRKTTARGPQRTYGRRVCIGSGDDGDDGLSLARSNVRLPGDGCRDNNNNVKPRLERQEAFRGPSVGGGFVSSDDVVENDADLYRLGLLYDDGAGDEGNRGSGFSLDAIVHDESLYPVRQSRRKQKRGKSNNTQLYTPGTPLHVIHESVEDSLYSMSPSALGDYLIGGEEDIEDWSFIPFLIHNGSSTTEETVPIDGVATPSTEAWVVLEGA